MAPESRDPVLTLLPAVSGASAGRSMTLGVNLILLIKHYFLRRERYLTGPKTIVRVQKRKVRGCASAEALAEMEGDTPMLQSQRLWTLEALLCFFFSNTE